jgi:hypothetical protein
VWEDKHGLDGDWDRQRGPSCARWAVIEGDRNSLEELVQLYADMALARARIEEALQELARRHRIRCDGIAIAMENCADDMLDAVVGDLKRRLSGDLEAHGGPPCRAAIRGTPTATVERPASEGSDVMYSLSDRSPNAAAFRRAG